MSNHEAGQKHKLTYRWARKGSSPSWLCRRPANTWFLLVADYAFGHQMANDLSKVVKTVCRRGNRVNPVIPSHIRIFLQALQSSNQSPYRPRTAFGRLVACRKMTVPANKLPAVGPGPCCTKSRQTAR
jgi:hypothetical protein